MHILLTRPLEDCSEMILKLKNLGHQISHLPLLKIEAVQDFRMFLQQMEMFLI
jgi:uroporphyrinogen-III synthase